MKRYLLVFFAVLLLVFVVVFSCFGLSSSASDSELSSDSTSSEDSSAIEYSQIISSDVNFEFSSYDVYSYDEEEFSQVIDIEGALSHADPDLNDGKYAFHNLFEDLVGSLHFDSVIFILLTVSFAFYVLGRL